MAYIVSQIRRHFNSAAFFKVTLTGFILILIVAIFILCSVPPVSRDALTHHLAVPKLYLVNGGMYEIPAIRFSYYPMNIDLLYLIPLYFGSDIVPKFIHFFFAILSGWLIYSYLKRRLDNLWARLGALMFLSLPVIVKLSITVYVDLGLIFFSTASLIFFLRWIEEQYQLRYLILSAVFCGLALGTKYNGLIIFFLLAVFVPFIYARREAHAGAIDRRKSENKNLVKYSKALGYAGLFIFIAFLIYSPWVIRNIIWTNNPVYPLYQSWFDPQERRISVNDAEDSQVSADPDGGRTKGSLKPLPRRRLLFNESWWQVMLVPVRIFFQGQDDNPQFFDGKLNPYLLLFPLFAFMGVKKDSATVKTEKLILLVFAVLYLMLAFFKVDMRIRWIAPIIPPLVILAVFGLHKIVMFLMDKYTPVTAMLGIGASLAVLLFLLIINAIYIFGQFKIVDPYSYLSGRSDRDAYIAKYRPEYPVIQYSNQHLAENDKILGLFLGKRRYYSDREIIFAARLFRQAVKNSRSANTIVSDLKKSGITHLLIRFDIFKTWSETVFSMREKEILHDFFHSNISLLITKGGYGLYQLKTNPG